MKVSYSSYVEINGIRYTKLVYMFPHEQDGINTNSDNIWFPMPSNCLVYISVRIPFPNCEAGVNILGYR